MQHKILKRYPLGNSKRVWRQDNFLLSTFQCQAENMRKAIENLKEAGFTMLELGWATHEQAQEAVRLCEELDISLIFQDFTRFGGMQDGNLDRKLSRGDVRRVVDELRPWKKTVGYYVWDEPYRDRELAEARRQIDLFLTEDPTSIAFSCAIPSYNTLYTWGNGEFPAYLRRFAETIEPPALSLDYYPINTQNRYSEEEQLDNSLLWCDLEMMRKLCREKQMPLWFYHQTFDRFECGHFSFPMARMMMYAAVMYGAKGLQNFSAMRSVLTPSGERGYFFEETKAINREFSKLGNTLMALDSRYVFHSDDLLPDCPYTEGLSDKIDESAIVCGKLPKRVSVGELSDRYGNDYLLVLNRDYRTAADVTIGLQRKSRIYEVDRNDGTQKPICEEADRIFVSLDAGDAVLLRVQDSSQEAYTIEYRIEKNEL